MGKEYIEREAVLAAFGEEPMIWTDSEEEFQEKLDWHRYKGIVEAQPAANVVEVRHGRWEFIGDDHANCTNCGTVFETRPTTYFFGMNNKFCRMCGARMDGED